MEVYHTESDDYIHWLRGYDEMGLLYHITSELHYPGYRIDHRGDRVVIQLKMPGYVEFNPLTSGTDNRAGGAIKEFHGDDLEQAIQALAYFIYTTTRVK